MRGNSVSVNVVRVPCLLVYLKRWLFLAWATALWKLLTMDCYIKRKFIIFDWYCMYKYSHKSVSHATAQCDFARGLAVKGGLRVGSKAIMSCGERYMGPIFRWVILVCGEHQLVTPFLLALLFCWLLSCWSYQRK